MAKTHDAKPRNKHRREKFKKEMERRNKGKPKPLTRRQKSRRVLQSSCLAIAKAQKELEIALRAVGIKWRAVEKAIHKAGGDWKRLDQRFVAELYADHGIDAERALAA